MYKKIKVIVILSLLITSYHSFAQTRQDLSMHSFDRMFSGEFRQDGELHTSLYYVARELDIQWDKDGEGYIIIEKSKTIKGADELVHYTSASQKRTLFVAAEKLQVKGISLVIESFTFSPDGTKILLFTNSSRVWRSNTKGDYWVYDLQGQKLNQLGVSFESSSLMFAKFSSDNKFAFYVHKFNI
jgi:dipeptidyl-peptidase-4